VIIAELVVLLKEKDAVVFEFSGGWSLLRVFNDLNYGKNINQIHELKTYIKGTTGTIALKDIKLNEAQMFKGTPRGFTHFSVPAGFNSLNFANKCLRGNIGSKTWIYDNIQASKALKIKTCRTFNQRG